MGLRELRRGSSCGPPIDLSVQSCWCLPCMPGQTTQMRALVSTVSGIVQKWRRNEAEAPQSTIAPKRSSGRKRTRPSCARRLRAWPDIGDLFAREGAEAAAAASLDIARDDVETTLRARRQALALAVALGDLAGELSLERVTALLSGFADLAIREALALGDERALSRLAASGIRGPGAGQARQRRAQLFVRRRSQFCCSTRRPCRGGRARTRARRRCGSGGG